MTIADAMARLALEARARALGLEPWQLEMAQAVDDSTLRGIVADNRRPIHERSTPAATQAAGAKSVPSRNGWQTAPALPSSPPGQRYLDAMMDQQDALDGAERVRRLARAGLLKAEASQDDP